jgi:hypothetical protein
MPASAPPLRQIAGVLVLASVSISRTLYAELTAESFRRPCMDEDAKSWAVETFGGAELGDVRRTARIVKMATAVAERPSGKVAAVFQNDREREGAYDFLENEQVSADDVMASISSATVRRCRGLRYVFVPVDGSSASVVDHTKRRDFGVIGNDKAGGRGAKVVNALAIDPDGAPVGLLAMKYWARPPKKKRPAKHTHAHRARSVEEKETWNWILALRDVSAALDEHGVRGWFQLDREADSRDLLLGLQEFAQSHYWTVRSDDDRSIELEGGDRSRLRVQLALAPISGEYMLEVRGRARRARQARMVVRVGKVSLRLRDRKTERITRLEVTAVWAREEGTAPADEAPLDWLLFTNYPVRTLPDAMEVIYGYTQRWRVEDFHRTWKSGDCDVESSQLRTFEAFRKWATILAANAVRIERLKKLSRTQPDAPATQELTPLEIRTLKLLHFGASPPEAEPTMREIVSWLAEMGGYANKYSGKPPGATVLGRGLRDLRAAARLMRIQEALASGER